MSAAHSPRPQPALFHQQLAVFSKNILPKLCTHFDHILHAAFQHKRLSDYFGRRNIGGVGAARK